jgi:alkanesulfonate monooxygenase SsuD/methylene tetrahydromethanopterin reductase-like flavin-dependent oxidoreductase (luciferase family)
MAARNLDIITKLNAWAFDPAHIARIGNSLAAMTGERWSLYLDTAPGQWRNQPVDDAMLVERAHEVLAIVAQHWLGRAEFVGKHVSSIGRMVGPRPSHQPALLLDTAMANAIGAAAIPVTQRVIAYGAGALASHDAKGSLLTCPVILGRTDAEAQSIAQECRSLQVERCVVGAPAEVAQKIRAAAQRNKAARVAIGFPAMRAIELELFDRTLMPMLRGNVAVSS